MGSSKWSKDYQKGKKDRQDVVADLNKLLIGSGMRFIRRHQFLKDMHISEKTKNNSLVNRLENAVFHKAMGLDYILIKLGTSMAIPFLLRFSNDAGFYIKLPKEFKDGKVNTFLSILTQENCQVLYAKKNKKGELLNLYNGPASLKNLVNLCGHWKSKTKGNKNRLQFSYNPSLLLYDRAFMGDLFGDSPYKRIMDLYDENIHGHMVN